MKKKMETVKEKIKRAQDLEGENRTVVGRLKEKLRDNDLPPERRQKIERALREAERLNREEAESCANDGRDQVSCQEAS